MVVLLFASACAGGNAIDEGVPSTALQSAALQTEPLEPFPEPARPDVIAEVNGTETNEAANQQSVETPSIDAEPVQLATATPPPVPARTSGPRNTGTYPSLADEPAPSDNQFSNREARRLMAEMQALQRKQQAGVVDTESYKRRLAELQRLAQTHSDKKLRQITTQ